MLSGTTVTLRSGTKLPVVGLGVWQAPSRGPARDAVIAALQLGYRHIDTARVYRNEHDVGEGIRASGVPRDQVFVTTKLWNDDHGRDNTLRAFDQSLERLGLDYIDLYLIHWPVAGKRLETWKAFEELHAQGRAKAIGVSNYLVRHLEELFAHANRKPDANQIELTPFLQRRDTVALCKREGIAIEAYSPLTRGEKLGHADVVAVAREVARTPAQVLLRWGIQHGFVVLPKSVRKERIAENGAVFDFTLSDAQMTRLDGLEENLVTGWDPADQP
jgi:diketogulonate reductase-like aldo/keto reductase